LEAVAAEMRAKYGRLQEQVEARAEIAYTGPWWMWGEVQRWRFFRYIAVELFGPDANIQSQLRNAIIENEGHE
jgi:hypothetical protein